MKPSAQTKANIVRPASMDSEALGQYIADQTAGVLRRLEDLRPFYEELWKRFEKLSKGQRILGCRTKTEFAEKILGRSMRSIQYALYGRRQIKSPIKDVIEELLPEEFVKEEQKQAREQQRDIDLEDIDTEEFFRNFKSSASAPETSFRSPIEVSDMPPVADLREFTSLGRRAAANKYHPDRGGDQARMAQLNQVADWLEQLAGAA
jgi:hypothetical protein